MKHTKWIFIIASLFLLFACERTVHIEIPQKEPRLVINGLLQKNDLFTLSVGKSRGILASDDNQVSLAEQYVVKNAVPVIFENGVAIDTLVYQPADFIYKTIHNKTVKDGFSYTIRINAPGYKAVDAGSFLPSQSVITELRRIQNSRTNSQGEDVDEITIKINDPAGERNFYLVQVWGASYGSPFGNKIYCVSTTDKDVEQIGDNTDPRDPDNCFGGSSILMRDNNFNGAEKLLKLFVVSSYLQEYADPLTLRTYRPYIKVFRITEDEFKYIKSYNAYYYSGDNPFAEPANVYSNIKNGYGIFSLSTMAVDTLR